MLFPRLPRLLAALLVGVCCALPIAANAQLSESEVTQYVPAEAFLVLSMNMETVMQKVDPDGKILKQYRERDRFSSIDFTETSQYLMIVTGGVEPENEYDLPALMITRYGETLQPEAYNKHASEQGFGLTMTYESEAYKDHEIYLGSYEQADGTIVMGSTSAHFFPGDNLVAAGTESVIKAVIDSLGDDSPGQELAGNLNMDAELHLLIDDGNNIVKAPFFEMMLGELTQELGLPGGVDARELLESLERLELIVDSSQMVPVQATIEMKSEGSAEKVEELIRTGLQAAPGLLMMGESALDDAIENEQEEIAPVGDLMKRLVALGKTAVEDIQVERNGGTIQIQLGNIDGLDQLPQDAITLGAWQSLQMEKRMENFQTLDIGLDEAPVEAIEIEDDGDKKSDENDDDGH